MPLLSDRKPSARGEEGFLVGQALGAGLHRDCAGLAQGRCVSEVAGDSKARHEHFVRVDRGGGVHLRACRRAAWEAGGF